MSVEIAPRRGNELPVPPQEGVRRHDRGDLTQRSTSQPERAHGEPASVVIREAQASPTQLRAQDAILFNEVGERLALLTIPPADHDGEPHLESRHVDHERKSISHADNWLSRAVDRIMGHFGEECSVCEGADAACPVVTPLVPR